MPEFASKDVAETEKGFGTGLRAQLERRREPAAGNGEAARAKAAPDSLPATPPVDVDDADLEALRSELAASLAREQQLRGALSEEVAAYERELHPQHDVAVRQAELDERAGRLSAFEAALEERERHVAEQVAALAREAKLAGRDEELSERQRQLDAKEQELAATAERLRKELAAGQDASGRAAAERMTALDEREAALAKRERELAERERKPAKAAPRNSRSLRTVLVEFQRVDRSVQTDARAKRARPDDGAASGAS